MIIKIGNVLFKSLQNELFKTKKIFNNLFIITNQYYFIYNNFSKEKAIK